MKNILGSLAVASIISTGCLSERPSFFIPPPSKEYYSDPDFVELNPEKFSLEYIENAYHKTKSLRNNNGKPVFSSDNHIVNFNFTHMSIEDAVTLSNLGYNSFEIYRYAQLGMSLEEIINPKDTEKPNALFTYPTKHNFGENYRFIYGTKPRNDAFDDEHLMDFYHQLKDSYDIRVIFTKSEKEIYRAISESRDLSLLVIGGHGTHKGIRVGRSKSERGKLDYGDTEFLKLIPNLRDDAVIFFYSCLTADPKAKRNFAKFVLEEIEKTNKEQGARRKLFASTHSFGGDNLEIIEKYPLEIRIIKLKSDLDNEIGEDIDATFTNKLD